ncbi:hypothetical protein OIU84_015652, partial [Salix udensis]
MSSPFTEENTFPLNMYSHLPYIIFNCIITNDPFNSPWTCLSSSQAPFLTALLRIHHLHD